MRRTSDWFVIPADFQAPEGQSGGITTRGGKRCIHRTLLPMLAPLHRAEVGPPLFEEEVASIDTPNLRPHQLAAATFAREREGSILAMAMGCVAGETEVQVNRAGKGYTCKIRTIWQRLEDPQWDRSHLWDRSITTYIRALCDGEIRLHRLRYALWKGRKPVLKLVLASGRNVRLTGDHEVALASGTWLPASMLLPGQEVLIAGSPGRSVTPRVLTVPQRAAPHVDGPEVGSRIDRLIEHPASAESLKCWGCGRAEGVARSLRSFYRGYCRSCVNRRRQLAGRAVDKDGYVRIAAGTADHPRRTTGGVYEHILVVEEMLGRHLRDDELVHHRNGRKDDNRLENLEVITCSVHHRRHGKHRNMEGGRGGKGGLVSFAVAQDQVVSVQQDGEDYVYDLVMEDPHRNFVANGIVVHNCGKTRTSLYAVREPRDQVGLVVAPKVTFPVWQKEIKLVFGEDYPVRVIRGRTLCDPDGKKELRSPGINLINPELLSARWSEWLGFTLDFGILDEAHYYTHSHAKRTNAAAALANLARRRIALTGTPIVRHVMDLHGIIQAIAPTSFGAWQRMAVWLELRKGTHGWDLSEPVSADARARLEARLAEIMVSQRWEDVSDEVPPLQRELLPVTFDDGDQEQYARLANDVREALGDVVNLGELVKASAAQLVQVLALRRFVGLSKIPRVVELVRSAGEPIVVWTWHREVAQRTAAVLRSHGFAVSIVTGEDPDKKRQQAIWKFQQAETDVFVGTIAVGGVGIDLTRARLTVYGELPWVPHEIAQSEARVFRTGQTRPCITYWPIFQNTIEDRIIEVLLAKADHARADIFPEGTAKIAAYNPEDEMVSLLDHAMEEDGE